MMRRTGRTQSSALRDRLVWQCASALLCYPENLRLDHVEELVSCIHDGTGDLLNRTLTALKSADPLSAAAHYVEVFDMQRRCSLYLTYWTAGETRNRGEAMLAFTRAYRRAGAQPPPGEAPDFLPVVLEFAAAVDHHIGRELLAAHLVPISVLRDALDDAGSPYVHTVSAVCATLPAASDQQRQRAMHLFESGPPAEAVGLQPFTLTVPPRRGEGNR